MPSHSKRSHAKLSASGADIWVNCKGFYKLNEQAGPKVRISNKYADRGTALHMTAEHAIIEGVMPEEGMVIEVHDQFKYELEQEDVEGLEKYISFIQDLRDRAYWFKMETPLTSLEEYHPLLGGTLDFSAIVLETVPGIFDDENKEIGVLYIVDLKSGRGKAVRAENNLQLLQYATGAYNGLLPEEREKVDIIKLVICQPYNSAIDDFDYWMITPADLIEHGSRIIEAAEEAEKGGPLTPGPWCQYCPVLGVCPAMQDKMVEMIDEAKDKTYLKDLILANPRDIPIDRIGDILSIFDILKPWEKNLREYALSMMESGVPVPRTSLVPKRARYAWAEEDPVMVKHFLEMGLTKPQIYNLKLKSPSQLKKEIKGQKELIAMVDDLVRNTATGYNLVSEGTDRVKKGYVTLTEFYNPLLQLESKDNE